MQPDSVPELTSRFGLVFPGEPVGLMIDSTAACVPGNSGIEQG